MVKLQSRNMEYAFIGITPGRLKPGVVVPVKVLSLSRIEQGYHLLFNHLTVCKPMNTWNHLTVSKNNKDWY